MQASFKKTCYHSAGTTAPPVCRFQSVAGCVGCKLLQILKGGIKMTIEALREAIARLITKRAEAHGNEAEQDRINAKLDKLYNLKYLALEQSNRN